MTTLDRETTWEVLDDLQYEIDYKPGYRFKFNRNDGSFSIYHTTENSIYPSEMRSTDHNFIVPMATYDRVNWIRWIFERIADIDNHERAEFYQVDGKRVYAPHHGNGSDPYFSWQLGSEVDADKSPGDD